MCPTFSFSLSDKILQMKILAEIHRRKGINLLGKTIHRIAVRGVILRGQNLLMVHSSVVGDYKFPGGGGNAFSNDANTKMFPTNDIPDDWSGMDIGPESIQAFSSALEGAKTVFWNGPMGVFEFDKFATGTNAIAKVVANLQGAYTVIGGGDSVSAIHQSGQSDKISHISTGGGASLELLEGKILPGVAALD